MSSSPEFGTVGIRIHARLRRVPRAHHDVKGVHAVRHRGRAAMARRVRSDVFYVEGEPFEHAQVESQTQGGQGEDGG